MTVQPTDGYKLVGDFCKLWAPPDTQTLSEWSEKNIVLTSEASAITGLIRLHPFQVEPFDAFTDPRIEQIVLMCGTQMIKTTLLLCALGFVVDKEPGPTLMVCFKEQDAEAFSKDRLAPTIKASSALREKVSEAKSRDSSNTILHKRFDGGHITLVGSISPSNLAARPIRYLFCDEVDKYPASAGTEGDPIRLATERTATYRSRRKIVLTCSPTVKGRSRISKAYDASDQRKPYVPCPSCGHYQKLTWSQVRWDGSLPVGERPATARYHCESCEAPWNDSQRWSACEKIQWRATAPFKGVAGFWISHLYSPWKTLAEIVEVFLEVKNDREQLKTFINTTLAELWEEEGERPPQEILVGRREEYPWGPDAVAPKGVLFLTCGVDVQADRLEYEIVGWGRYKENWSLAYEVIEVRDSRGAPLSSNSIELWNELEKVLAREVPHVSGVSLSIMVMAIDTGDRPRPVYEFASKHAAPYFGPAGIRVVSPRTVIPVKGNDDNLRLISTISNENAARKRGGIRIVTVGTHAAKQEIYDALRLPRPSADAPAPGYCHYPMYRPEYFDGVVSEKRIVHTDGKITWEKIYPRNEPLDCRVYNRLAYSVFGADRFSEEQWNVLDQAVNPEMKRTEVAASEPPVDVAPSSGNWFSQSRRGGGWFQR